MKTPVNETYKERIDRMNEDEYARFLEGFDIDITISDPQCKKCKQDHGLKCPHLQEIEETDYCPVFPKEDVQLIKNWLNTKVNGPIRLKNGEVIV